MDRRLFQIGEVALIDYGVTRVCLKNSLIRNFGVFSAISASSILDLALLSLRIYSLN